MPAAIQEQGSLPGAVNQATAAQSVDVISDLMRHSQQQYEEAAQAVKMANQPIAGGHVAPQAAHLPGAGANHVLYGQNNNPVVGHHNATMRGIDNVARGVSNLITQVSQQEEQRETSRLAVNMERLMSATSSMDQAKAALQQDPNNKDAQEQLQKAQGSADEILGDPKVRKRIQKAYNINFTDPSKNNTPEHAALKQATESFTQQFQRQIPTQMQPNVAAQQAAQLKTAEAAATAKTVDAVIKGILDKQGKVEAATIGAESRVQAAGMAAQSREKVAQIGYAKTIKAAQISKDARLGAAFIAANGAMQRLNKKIDEAHGKGLDQMNPKEINDYIKTLQSEAQKIPDSISHLEQLRQDKGAIKANRTGVYDAAIRDSEDNLKTINEEIANARGVLQKKGGMKSGDAGPQPKQNNQTASITSTNPNDYDNPDDEDDDS